MGFLKFCSVLLNMVCGYPTVKDCVVCLGSLAFGCVFGFGLLGLVCVVGIVISVCYYWGFRENWLIVLLLWINFQCFLSKFLSIITKLCDKDQFLLTVF